jgi:uncharacterized protein
MSGWPVVDSIQFAKQHKSARCIMRASEFGRLAETACNGESEFQVRLEGSEDSEGKPHLRLLVDGTITVTCQRCLEPLAVKISSERDFVLVGSEQDLLDLSDEAEDIESLVADSKLNVLTLAEDEILLQIPMAPMHAEGSCSPPQWATDAGNNNSAFSMLSALTNEKDR